MEKPRTAYILKSDRNVSWLKSLSDSDSLLIGFPSPSTVLCLLLRTLLALPTPWDCSLFVDTSSPFSLLSIGEFQDLVSYAHLLHSPHPPPEISPLLSVSIIIYVLMTLEFISPVQTLLWAPGHKLSCLFHILTWPSPGTSDSAWPQTELTLFPYPFPPPAFPGKQLHQPEMSPSSPWQPSPRASLSPVTCTEPVGALILISRCVHLCISRWHCGLSFCNLELLQQPPTFPRPVLCPTHSTASVLLKAT